MRDHRLRNVILAVLLLLAFALRCGLAIAYPNLDRADEIYQTIEPAYRLVTGWGVVTWEWRDGIRSWLFPGFLAAPVAVSEWLGFGRAGYVPAIGAMLSLLSAATVAVAFAFGWRHSRLAGSLLCAVPALLWPDLLYFGSKALLEVQAGNLLVIAVALAALPPTPEGPRPRTLA